MTLLELKVICIKNVSQDNETNFNTENYSDYSSDPRYADYINNIDIAINQALARLVTSEKIPSKIFRVNSSQITNDLQGYVKIDLSSLEPSVYRIKKVYFRTHDGLLIHPMYSKPNADTLLVTKYSVDGEYEIVYSINIDYLQDNNIDLKDTFNIKDSLLNSFVVPFVKAKLWEAEEPNLAQQYMNYAESYLNAYDNDETNIEQPFVESAYSWF